MDLNEKYELYQILTENNFVPSKNNLSILTENLDNEEFLNEGLRKSIKKWKNKRHARKRMKQMWKDGKAGPQVKAASQENKSTETPNEEEVEK